MGVNFQSLHHVKTAGYSNIKETSNLKGLKREDFSKMKQPAKVRCKIQTGRCKITGRVTPSQVEEIDRWKKAPDGKKVPHMKIPLGGRKCQRKWK
jgi:hypothetical protein